MDTNTNYTFTPEYLAEKRSELESDLGDTLNLKAMCSNLLSVVRANKTNYLRYGPYWWPLKSIMAEQGLFIGNADDQRVNRMFRLADDIDTVIAAYYTGEQYIATSFKGARTFDIFPEGFEPYSLYDPDVEG